jgi:chemotaxis protein CheX
MEIAALGGGEESVEALIVPLETEYGKIEVNVAIRERQ